MKDGYFDVDDPFWSMVYQVGSEDTACWEWQGRPEKDGYARISIKGRKRYVHRVAWEKWAEREIPAGLVIRHGCNNRICVRPTHLTPGTQSENILDTVRSGTHRNSRKTHCSKGHPLGEVIPGQRRRCGQKECR